jgi:hypothetical protein
MVSPPAGTNGNPAPPPPTNTRTQGEVPPGKLPYFCIPVLNFHEGHLSVNFSSNYYILSQRHADVPRLTPAHLEVGILGGGGGGSVCVCVRVDGGADEGQGLLAGGCRPHMLT